MPVTSMAWAHASPKAAPPATAPALTAAYTPVNTDEPMQPAIWKPVDMMVTPWGFSSKGSFESAKLCTGPMTSAEPQMTGM